MTSSRRPQYEIGPFESTAAERRAAVVREENEHHAARQKLLAAQVSPTRSAEQRIQIWERLHATWLPRDAEHRLVSVIATQTALTVEQIRGEQQRRATAALPAVEPTPV